MNFDHGDIVRLEDGREGFVRSLVRVFGERGEIKELGVAVVMTGGVAVATSPDKLSNPLAVH